MPSRLTMGQWYGVAKQKTTGEPGAALSHVASNVRASALAELIEAKRLAIDEHGKVLARTGEGTQKETENRGNGESEKNGQLQPTRAVG